jgi:hypothetical protein
MSLASFDRLRVGSLIALVAVACGGETSSDPTSGSSSTTDDDPTTEGAPTTDPDPTTTTTTAPDPDTTTVDPDTTTVDPDSSSSDPTATSEPAETGLTTGEMGVCGDGVLSPDEDCEGDEYNITCESLGLMQGQGVCNDQCQLDTSACYLCGNGLVEQAEGCDGPLGALITCETEGFSDGTLVCDTTTCQLDTSGCSLCGDDEITGNEACDGSDLAGQSCQSLGFDGGELGCDADCSVDFAGCSGGQYVQDFEGGALPGELTTSGDAVWIVDMTSPITGSYSAHSGNIDDSESSVLTLQATFAIAGTVEFRHVESTEDNFDYLEFWIDGAMQDEWSGVTAEMTESYPVAAGNHTFEWRYTKDGSLDEGTDTVWIDDIVLVGGVPS